MFIYYKGMDTPSHYWTNVFKLSCNPADVSDRVEKYIKRTYPQGNQEFSKFGKMRVQQFKSIVEADKAQMSYRADKKSGLPNPDFQIDEEAINKEICKK
jgi:hypothetical protein